MEVQESRPSATSSRTPFPTAAGRAVKKLQAAVRKRLRRRRVVRSWFELEVEHDWGLGATPHAARRTRPRRQVRCVGSKHRVCCRMCAFVGAFFLCLAVYITTMVVNLLQTGLEGCSSSACLQRVSIGSLCTRDLVVSAELQYPWRPWSTVIVESIEVDVFVDDYNHTGLPMRLAHGSFPGPTLTRSHGHMPLQLNASLELATAEIAGVPLHSVLSAGLAHFSVSTRTTVRSPSLTGPLPIRYTAAYTAHIVCANLTCALADEHGTPSAAPPPPPSPSHASSLRVGGIDFRTPSSGHALVEVRSWLTYNQSFPLDVTLPPIEATLACATPRDDGAQNGHSAGEDIPSLPLVTRGSADAIPADDGAARIAIEDAAASRGTWSSHVAATLQAETSAQGRELRGLLHAALVCHRGEAWCHEAPTVYSRFHTSSAHVGACYFSSVLQSMPPLPLPLAGQLQTSSAVTDALLGARPHSSTGDRSTNGSSSDSSPGVTMSDHIDVRMISINESRASAHVSGSVRLPWAVTGTLPAFGLTLCRGVDVNDERYDAEPIAAISIDAPISLSNLPALAASLAVNVSAEATALAALFVRHTAHTNATVLMHALASHSIAARGMTTHGSSGLDEVRIPLNWLVTPADLPATHPLPPTSAPAALHVRLRTLAVNGVSDVATNVSGSVGAAVNASGFFPRWLRLSSGGTLQAVGTCQQAPPAAHAMQMMRMTVQPMAIDGNGSVDVRISATGNPRELSNMSSMCSDVTLHAMLCPESLPSRRCEPVVLSRSTVVRLADAWFGSSPPSASRTAGEFAVNLSVTESAEIDRVGFDTHMALPLLAPINLETPPLGLMLRSGSDVGPEVLEGYLHGLQAEAGRALLLHGALVLTVAHRAALGDLIHAAMHGGVRRLCVDGGLTSDPEHAIRACMGVEDGQRLLGSENAPAMPDWLSLGGVELQTLALSGTADLNRQELSPKSRFELGVKSPMQLSLPWLKRLALPAVGISAHVLRIGDQKDAIVHGLLKTQPFIMESHESFFDFAFSSTLTPDQLFNQAWQNRSLLSRGLRVELRGSGTNALSRCLPDIAFNVSSRKSTAARPAVENMERLAVNISVDETEELATFNTHALLPVDAPMDIYAPPLDVTITAGGDAAQPVAAGVLAGIEATKGSALRLHAALVLAVNRRAALGRLVRAARLGDVFQLCFTGGVPSAPNDVNACIVLGGGGAQRQVQAAAMAPHDMSWLRVGALHLDGLTINGTADMLTEEVSVGAQLGVVVSVPIQLSLPWQCHVSLPAIRMTAAVVNAAGVVAHGGGMISSLSVASMQSHILALSSTMQPGAGFAAAYLEPDLLSTSWIELHPANGSSTLSRCLPDLTFNLSSIDSGNSTSASASFGVNVHVLEGLSSNATVKVGVTLPLAAPLDLGAPPMSLTLREGGAAKRPIANVILDQIELDEGDTIMPQATVLLSVAHRPALRGLYLDIVNGDALHLCMDGGIGGAGVNACTISTSNVSNASSASWFDNATIDLRGPSDIAVPCVFPWIVCPKRTRTQLQALAASTALLGVTMPVPPPIAYIIRRYSMSVQLPSTHLAWGFDQFDHIGSIRLPPLTLEPTTSELNMTVEARVQDWYGLSRVVHPFGRAFETEHRWRTFRLRGGDNDTNWGRVLPLLFTHHMAPPSNGTTFIFPTPFYIENPSPSDPPQLTLVASTATSATIRAPISVDSPLPFAVSAQTVSMSITTQTHGHNVKVADVVKHGPGVIVPPTETTDIELLLTLYLADGFGGGSCVVDECYADGSPQNEALCQKKMCAVGLLLELYTGGDVMNLTLAASIASRDGAASVAVTMAVELYGDRSQRIDSASMFMERDTTFFADTLEGRLYPPPTTNLVYQELDIFGSIEQSILHGITSDKGIDGVLALNVTNVFSFPAVASRYVIGEFMLKDVDGVPARSTLMAATKFTIGMAPNLTRQLVGRFSSPITNPTAVLHPGGKTRTTVRIPMHWESVVRYVDEMYMKNQGCTGVSNGRVDLTVNAGGAHDAPVSFTMGFSPRELGGSKRRACHVPLSCNLCTFTSVFTGGCNEQTCVVGGSAILTGGAPGDGGIRLVNMSDPQKEPVGSVFSTAHAPLLDGFRSTFEFEIARDCPAEWRPWGWCKPLSGGFAFVLSNFTGEEEPRVPPIGRACHIDATVVQPGMTNPTVPTLIMNNNTHISCSGYAGIPASIGVVFSLATGPVGNRYWTVAAPILDDLSDWPRGSLSLYVNGDMRNTVDYLGPARGVAQHGSSTPFQGYTDTKRVHSVEVTYSRSARMLYVTLDGASAPDLWVELDPADLGLGPSPELRAGFTSSGTASGEKLSIDIRKWAIELTAADGTKGRLLEEGDLVGIVGEPAAVHIDARDGCDQPRVTGGLVWAVTIRDSVGNQVAVEGVDDLGDGTTRVRFTPSREGAHNLKGVTRMPGYVATQAFGARFDIAAARVE